MDIARHKPTDKVYHAVGFSQLPEWEIETLRVDLECPECRGPAFYRKPSRSGQGACFGARPHQPDCSMSSTDALEVEGLGTEENALANVGDTIVLDLRFGAVERVHTDGDGTDAESRGNGRRFVGGGMRPNAKSHRRLSRLLDSLILYPALRNSDIAIEYGDLGPFPARSFFISLADVSPNHWNEIHGIWGGITSYGIWNGDLWLNSGGRSSVSIKIDSTEIAAFLERAKIKDLEDLVGSYVLAVGTINISTRKKLYLVPKNVDHITLKRSVAGK